MTMGSFQDHMWPTTSGDNALTNLGIDPRALPNMEFLLRILIVFDTSVALVYIASIGLVHRDIKVRAV